MQDNGSAAFHLRAAQLPPQVSEIPIRTQIRLRGIMGMTFGGMKRVPFEKLRGAYPDAAAFYRSCSVEWTRERDLTVPCGRRLSAAPGGIDEAFLHSVDATHVLGSYDTVEQVLSPEESIWQKRVAANLDFALCGTPLILYAS